jgi:hypothetical protein
LNGATIGAPTANNHEALNETWTITYTGSGKWAVVGSESGEKIDATSNVAYDNGCVSFKITAPNEPGVGAVFSFIVSKAWATGDRFTFTTTCAYDDYKQKLHDDSTAGTCDIQAMPPSGWHTRFSIE